MVFPRTGIYLAESGVMCVGVCVGKQQSGYFLFCKIEAFLKGIRPFFFRLSGYFFNFEGISFMLLNVIS